MLIVAPHFFVDNNLNHFSLFIYPHPSVDISQLHFDYVNYRIFSADDTLVYDWKQDGILHSVHGDVSHADHTWLALNQFTLDRLDPGFYYLVAEVGGHSDVTRSQIIQSAKKTFIIDTEGRLQTQNTSDSQPQQAEPIPVDRMVPKDAGAHGETVALIPNDSTERQWLRSSRETQWEDSSSVRSNQGSDQNTLSFLDLPQGVDQDSTGFDDRPLGLQNTTFPEQEAGNALAQIDDLKTLQNMDPNKGLASPATEGDGSLSSSMLIPPAPIIPSVPVIGETSPAKNLQEETENTSMPNTIPVVESPPAPTTAITISGTISTPPGKEPKTVFISINGAPALAVNIQENAIYSALIDVQPGDVVVAYFNNAPSKGASITIAKSVDMTLDIASPGLIVKLQDGDRITNRDLARALQSNDPRLSDIYAVDHTNALTISGPHASLTVTGGPALLPEPHLGITNATYAPEGDITVSTYNGDAKLRLFHAHLDLQGHHDVTADSITAAVATIRGGHGTVTATQMDIRGNFYAGNGTWNVRNFDTSDYVIQATSFGRFEGESATINVRMLTLGSPNIRFGNAHLQVDRHVSLAAKTNVDPGTSTFEFVGSAVSITPNAHPFHHVTFNPGDANGLFDIRNPMRIRGTFTILYAKEIRGAPIQIEGDLITHETWTEGSARFQFIGDNNHSIATGGRSIKSALPAIEINKSGGTLVLDGWFETKGDWRHIAGHVDPGQSRIIFNDRMDPQSIDASAMAFYDVQINRDEKSLTIHGDLHVLGLLTLSAKYNASIDQGRLVAYGDVMITQPTFQGTASLRMQGSWDQALLLSPSLYNFDLFPLDLEIMKPSGIVTLYGGRLNMQDAAQYFRIESGAFDLNGYDLVTRPDTVFRIGSKGRLCLKGHESLPSPEQAPGSQVIYTGQETYSGLSGGSSYENLSFTGGMTTYLSFDDAGDSAATDASGLFRTADLIHMDAQAWIHQDLPPTDFANTGALNFNLSDRDDYVLCVFSGRNLVQDFSMSLWFKTLHQETQTLLSATNIPGFETFSVVLTDSSQLQIRLYESNYVWDIFNVTDGLWHHLTIVHDTHRKEIEIFLDGIPEASQTISVSYYAVPVASGALFLGQKQGAVEGSFDPNLCFFGQMDDFRVYAYALDPLQVNDLSFGRHPSPRGRFQLQEALTVHGDLTLNAGLETNGQLLTVNGRHSVIAGTLK